MKNILFWASLLLVAACNLTPEAEKNVTFINVAELDSTVRPGDNFFRFVNGRWYDTATIADDQTGVGYYRFLNIPQRKLLQNILEEVSATENEKGSIEQQVGDFYASGMDTVTINERGFQPVQALLTKIDDLTNTSELMDFVANEIKSGNHSLISFNISPDQQNSKVNMAHFIQFGLGLPDRDYYFKTDAATAKIQEAYKVYLTTLFELSNIDDPRNKAEQVYAIENKLAEAHITRIQRRDVQANYHKMAVSTLNKMHPAIHWNKLLERLGIREDSIDVKHPAYFNALDQMLQNTPLNDWKSYLKADLLKACATILSTSFKDARFAYNKVISGKGKQGSRSEFMARRVDGHLGFALGQLYVKRHFNEDAKKRALELVDNLIKAFEHRINNLDWMSDSTKLRAKEKLYAITKKIGYPDEWRDYSGVGIDRNRFFENVIALRQNNFNYRLEKLSKPPNKEEWYTTPSTVTAYYNSSFNEIVFPAGILQSPYFDLYADDALNYGGIGIVIGHELTHAFDDQGAQFDKDGNLNNWWSDEDYTKFRARTQRVIDLYSTFTVLDTVHLKGALTVGENTADNGGIAIAYDAFKMTKQGQDTTRIDGFTPDQRFILSSAKIWRVKTRDEFMRNYVRNDPHSPAVWRVNGPLMSFAPFYEAFDVKKGDKNYLPVEERVSVW